jgi:hypothetical protein
VDLRGSPGVLDENLSPSFVDSNMLHTVPGRGAGSSQPSTQNDTNDHLLGGLKQRLLSYLFRSIEVQDADPVAVSLNLVRV